MRMLLNLGILHYIKLEHNARHMDILAQMLFVSISSNMSVSEILGDKFNITRLEI